MKHESTRKSVLYSTAGQFIIEEAHQTYGKQKQLAVAIEECSELIKEISRLIRNDTWDMKPGFYKEMALEIADVRIMCEQLENMYGLQDMVEVEMANQLVRLSSRIEHYRRDNYD